MRTGRVMQTACIITVSAARSMQITSERHGVSSTLLVDASRMHEGGMAYANGGFIQPAPANASCMTALALVILTVLFTASIKNYNQSKVRQMV